MRPLRTTMVSTIALLLLLPTTPAGAGDATIEQWLASERQAHGVPALATCADLESYAQMRADEMAVQDTIWHRDDIGSGIAGWLVLSEIVGEGTSVSAIIGGWTGSAFHRGRYLDPRVTEAGVGLAHAGDGRAFAAVVLRDPVAPCGGSGGGTAPIGEGSTTVPPPASVEPSSSSTPGREASVPPGDGGPATAGSDPGSMPVGGPGAASSSVASVGAAGSDPATGPTSAGQGEAARLPSGIEAGLWATRHASEGLEPPGG